MTTVNSIVADLTPIFPEVPSAVLSWALQKAIRRFTADTSALQETFTFETQACLQEYLIVPPECATINSIIKVERVSDKHESRELQYEFGVVDPVVTLKEAQKDGVKVEVTYSYAPSGLTCAVPSNIYPKYEDLILRLVRHNLYSSDNSEWSNPKRGDYELSMYNDEVKSVAALIRTKGKRGPRKIIGSNFLRVGSGVTTSGRYRG